MGLNKNSIRWVEINNEDVINKNENMDIEQAFELFINYKKSTNIKPASIESYRNHFRKFHMWYDGELENINNDTIIDYTNYLIDAELAPSSIASYKRHIGVILNYFYKKGWIYCEIEPIPFKIEEQIKEVFTKDQLQLIIKRPSSNNISFAKFRNWAMAVVLAGTGMRIGTLVNIKLKDIDFNNKSIIYRHNKNSKINYITLSKQLEQDLRFYLKYRVTDETLEDEYLFPNSDNTTMNARVGSKNIKKHLLSRGITKGSAHLFRHTFAKNWLMNGGEAIILKKILGHRDFKMVEHYSNLWGVDINRNFESFDMLTNITKNNNNNNIKNEKKKVGKRYFKM